MSNKASSCCEERKHCNLDSEGKNVGAKTTEDEVTMKTASGFLYPFFFIVNTPLVRGHTKPAHKDTLNRIGGVFGEGGFDRLPHF